MISLREFVDTARAELPAPILARWASILFSLSVLTMLLSLAASQALLFLAVAVYTLHLLRDPSALRFLPVKLPLALFIFFTILSIYWAANPVVGWFAVRKLTLFLIWLLAVNLISSARHLRMLLQVLFLEAAAAGVIGVVQFMLQYHEVRALHPGRVYFYMIPTRIHGFMGHWMNFGGQEMLVFAVLLAYLLLSSKDGTRVSGVGSRVQGVGGGESENAEQFPMESPLSSESRVSSPESRASTPNTLHPTPHTRLWWLVLAVVALAIALNFTRGVWLGCFVGALYVVARWKARWLWALPVLAAISFLASPSLVRHRVWLAFHPTEDPALSIRFEMWGAGLRMMRAHPLVGVGPNNIVEVYALYLPPGKSPEVGFHEHMHNDFIQFGAERGLPCLAAWIWLMAALGWHIRRVRRRLRAERWVADGAFAAWLALLAEGCFEFNFGTSPVLMVFLFLTALPFVAEGFTSRADSRQANG